MKSIVFTDIHSHSDNNQASEIIRIESKDIVSDPFINDIGFFSAGIHPWYIPKQNAKWHLQFLDKILLHEKCLVIGECGLDFHIKTDHAVQTEIFEHQLQLAHQHQKPVIIHCVKAFHELIRIKKTRKLDTAWIIHGFSKSAETAQQCIDAGIFLSIGDAVFKPHFESVVKCIPDEFLFFETDNSTTSIIDIYKKASQIREVTCEALAKTVLKNFSSVFGIL
jgi:TatD DNase family protein